MTKPTDFMEYCLVCDGRTQFTLVYEGAEIPTGYGAIVYNAAAECVVCRLLLTGHADTDGNFQPVHTSRPTLRGKSFPDVPAHIASTASEAHRSLQAECFRGAVILARAVIEATAKDKDIAVRGIAAKIREMEEQRLIRPHVREGADEVRHFGNDMAHGDFIGEVGATEVALALELMDDVLNEVYQSPARVEKARARRNRAAEASGQSGATTATNVPPLGAISTRSRPS